MLGPISRRTSGWPRSFGQHRIDKFRPTSRLQTRHCDVTRQPDTSHGTRDCKKHDIGKHVTRPARTRPLDLDCWACREAGSSRRGVIEQRRRTGRTENLTSKLSTQQTKSFKKSFHFISFSSGLRARASIEAPCKRIRSRIVVLLLVVGCLGPCVCGCTTAE